MGGGGRSRAARTLAVPAGAPQSIKTATRADDAKRGGAWTSQVGPLPVVVPEPLGWSRRSVRVSQPDPHVSIHRLVCVRV